jgi:hypothetical protein
MPETVPRCKGQTTPAEPGLILEEGRGSRLNFSHCALSAVSSFSSLWPGSSDSEAVAFTLSNRGLEKRQIFPDEREHAQFLDLLSVLPTRFGLKIHADVLMGSHYHLLIETPRPISVRPSKRPSALTLQICPNQPIGPLDGQRPHIVGC